MQKVKPAQAPECIQLQDVVTLQRFQVTVIWKFSGTQGIAQSL